WSVNQPYKKVKNYARGRSSTFNGEELTINIIVNIFLIESDNYTTRLKTFFENNENKINRCRDTNGQC
ncbi:hypothetical protein, partial [Brevibacillus agri]|uniref:hypothetical protein n=1 Tax=Brevibacillus agri TaxID=51101 RepID=UPI001EE569A4